jgi:membrane-associated phospholipid phosphatase
VTDKDIYTREIPTLGQVEHVYGQLPTLKEVFYDWGGANVALFQFINGIHGSGYNEFMRFATQIGDRHFFVPYLMMLGIYAFLSILYRKLFRKGAVMQHFIMWIGIFVVMVASFVTYAVIISWFKDYFAYARPYALIEGVVQLEMKDASEAYRSFPSGHVAFISLMIFSLWPLLSKHMKLFGAFIILLVSWSRVSMGVHFPADALWGCALGFAIVFSMRVVIYTLLRKLFGIYCDGA